MKLRIVRDGEGLRALQGPWDEMLRASSFTAPYYSWDWQEAWWKHFGHGSELFVVVGEEGGRLQVVAPLICSPASVRGFKVREIRFLAHSITPHHQILFRNECPPEQALAAVLQCLADHCDEWDMLNLWNIPASASYLPLVEQATAQSGLRVLQQPGIHSAYISLEGTLDEYFQAPARRGHKRGVLQKVRQLTAQRGYQVSAYCRPEEIAQAMDLAFEVSRSSWKAKLGADLTGLDARRNFYAEVTPRLAQRGAVRIWIASLEQVPVALQYHLLSAEKAYFIVNDFHQDYGKLSPGTVLLYQVLQRMFQEKRHREFYFSGDLYEYKRRWATGIRPHVNLEIFHRRPYSRFLWWSKHSVVPLLRTAKVKMFGSLPAGAPVATQEPSC